MDVSILAIPVILAGIFSSSDGILRALMVCFLFGGTAAISITALGNAPVLPAVLLMPFLAWRAISDKTISVSTKYLAYPEPGFWLLLFVLWGVFSAFAFPRIFAGETMVFGMDRLALSPITVMPLRPFSTHLTQSAYAILGLVCFVSVRSLLNSERRMVHMRDAILLLASLNIGAAVLQLAESYLGFPSFLNLVRNANYATFTSGEIGGLVRIYGTFPEASAFAGFTLGLFAFAASLCRDGVRPVYSGSVALASLLLLLISTSSTAYVSLIGYTIAATAAAVFQAYWNNSPLKVGPTALTVWLAAVTGCVALLIKPELLMRLSEFFELTLFDKLESGSGRERADWTQQGWINFIDTYGFGIGFGGARSSSFPIALLSNVGVIGTFLFVAFLWRLFDSSTAGLSHEQASVVRAARHALLISLMAALVNAPFADPGMLFYTFAAVVAAGIIRSKSQPLGESRLGVASELLT